MTLKIRPVQPGDAQRIWEIRNEPQSRAIAASPDIIPLPQHINWFNNKYFGQNSNVCFVGELDDNIVGYCRFDLDNNQYTVSIAVTSSMHGKGIGTLLLRQSIEQLNSTIPLYAEIRKNNISSIKMFEKIGFKKISEDDKNLYFQLPSN